MFPKETQCTSSHQVTRVDCYVALTSLGRTWCCVQDAKIKEWDARVARARAFLDRDELPPDRV